MASGENTHPELGPPPTYEQALTHRTLETSQYAGPPYYASLYDLFEVYPAPRGPRARPPSGNSAATTVYSEAAVNCVSMTLPPMHMCMAATCLVLNIIIPGTGGLNGLTWDFVI
jgi:hypothetical protein